VEPEEAGVVLEVQASQVPLELVELEELELELEELDHSSQVPVELVVLLEVVGVVVVVPQVGVVDELLEELEVVEVVLVVHSPESDPHCGTATAEPASARATIAVVYFILTVGEV